MMLWKMFLLSSNKATLLSPTATSGERPPIFTESVSNTIDCWDLADILQRIDVVAIGKLVKTPSGYSPLLISNEYPSEAAVRCDLTLEQPDVVTRASLMKSLEPGLFVFDGVPFGMILAGLQIFFRFDLSIFYDHLVDHKQAREEGFFFVEGTLNGLMDIQEKTMLVDGRDLRSAWCMLLPYNITSDELAFVIEQNFSAICGLLRFGRSDVDYSVFLFSKRFYPAWMDNSDYRHCISYVIDEQGLEGYITPRTHEENRRALIQKLMELTDPSLEEFDEQKIFDLNSMLVKERGRNPKELLSIDDDYYDEHRPEILSPFCGAQYMLNISLDVQIQACSKIMGLSIGDTMIELKSRSALRIQAELAAQR